MGKKRRMISNPARFSKKYAKHPIIKKWLEAQEAAPEASPEAAQEVVLEAPAPKKSAPAPAKRAVERKAPLRSAAKKTTKKS